MARPNNTVTYGYDALGQLLSASGVDVNSNPRLNENFAYGYDSVGNLTSVVAGIEPTASHLHLAYTAANQLQGVPEMDNTLLHGTLDMAANSLQGTFTGANISTNYTFSQNQDLTFGAFVPLTQANHTTNDTATAAITGYDSDNNVVSASQFTLYNLNPGRRNVLYSNRSMRGDLTQDHQNNYVYDALGQVVGIDGRNYTYDGLGRLISYTGTSGTTTKLVYSGHNVIREINGTSAVNYTYGNNMLLGRTDASGTAYYHQDANGNVVDMTDASGNQVARYLYEPYGQLIAAWGKLAATNLYRFSSERFDTASGLYYYGYRFYSPELRRWLNQDPIQERGGLNLYRFVGNDPLNEIDLYGLDNIYGGYSGGTYNNNVPNITLSMAVTAPVYVPPVSEVYQTGDPAPYVAPGYTQNVPTKPYDFSTAYDGTDPNSVIMMIAAGNALADAAGEGLGAGLGAALKTPRTPFIKVCPPNGKFGLPDFGFAMQDAINQELRKQFPDIKFNFPSSPYANGPDIIVSPEDADVLGFKSPIAEIKPDSDSGWNSFSQQILNWQNKGVIPPNAPVQVLTYDAQGNLYLGFTPK